MITNALAQRSDNMADRAAVTADHAIRSTQYAVNGAFDSLADSVQDLRHQAAPALERGIERAGALRQRGIDSVRHGTRQLRETAHSGAEHARGYVRDEPFKALLIAAATGAIVAGLLSWLGRPDPRR